MTSTGRKHANPTVSPQIGRPVVTSESQYYSGLESNASTTRSVNIITQTPSAVAAWSLPNDNSNLSSASLTQQNFPSVPRYIPRLTEHRLSSSPGASTLPSLAASPSSSTLSSSSNSLLFSSPSLILSNSPPFSTTSTGLMSSNLGGSLSSSPPSPHLPPSPPSPPYQQLLSSRSRSRSRDTESFVWSPPTSPVIRRGKKNNNTLKNSKKATKKLRHSTSEKNSQTPFCTARALSAMKENDSMVYLDGPRIYACGECRTHLTSHDEIISKSFHGRHGRAYLFDQCVNYTVGTAEDRRLITGLHSVCDIFCKRCKTLIGWTYDKAYEPSQKYKEGKFIIEKINLHMEENSNSYEVNHPAGERRDRWRVRAMGWGSEVSSSVVSSHRVFHPENPDMV